MNNWQQKARNKASEDKRKGAKQGAAIVEWMRKQDELKRKDSVQSQETMEGVQGKPHQD